MQMKRWTAALLAICLLTLSACAAKERPYPQQTQTQQMQDTQDTLRQLLSEELPQEQPEAEETPALEEPEAPGADTEPVEDEPAEEPPENTPEPLPDEPEDGASDGPEAEPPEDTLELAPDEPEDGVSDAPAEDPPDTPNQPSDVATLPLEPGDDAGGVTTKPEGPSVSDEEEEQEPPVKDDTEDDPTDEPKDSQDQNNDQQEENGQGQESGETGTNNTLKESSTEAEQSNAGQQIDKKPNDIDDGGRRDPEASPDGDSGETQEKNPDETSAPENETSNDPETDPRENMEEQLPDEPEKPERSGTGWMIAFIAVGLLAAAEGAYIWLQRRRSVKKRHPEKEQVSTTQMPQTQSIPTPETVSRVVVGKAHAQGARESQQDSFSVSSDTMQPGGILAIVADGMGGLSDGDKVSQTIVSAVMHAFVSGEDTCAPYLPALLAKAKIAVDQLLGPDGIQQSGSTVVMGMIRDGLFDYLSVGDSRICLYRDGELHQLNRSHSYAHDLLVGAINGEKTFDEIRTDRRAECLTSYIGMGELVYVDIPAAPIKVHPGDVFVLMSDGVFNALTEQELSAALGQGAEDAAKMIDQWIQKKNYRNQDNYTAVILQCCADDVHESPERN